MLAPGVRLGRYEVLSPLGAGGMGEVYRARDTELGRNVALKVLPDDLSSDPDRLKRFEREATATAALSHPNVLTVFDVGREDGRAYLVFELLEGSTLGTRLARGPLPTAEALACAVQIGRGLAVVHARGLVHRDLKPDNLFLTTTGTLKILDFGLARRQPAGERATTASDVTAPGAVAGTVSYMSPEQAKGHPGDARSDIFSLGTVLYEMLTGRHPFKRDSSAETLSAILREEPGELGRLGNDVPGALERLVRRCLEKKPGDRFQTANDLALALEALRRPDDRERRSPSREAPDAEERPYPGLSSFTEADAARFFGREAEVTALWAKVKRRKLLAVIGPSGAGKTSFLRAGVIPSRPEGWSAIYFVPGTAPVGALARALTPQLTGDPAAMASLVEGATDPEPDSGDERLLSAIAAWRQRSLEGILVVDQFEELFTLSSAEVQARFASLLDRMAEEVGVRVLICLRDDFFFQCHSFPSLAPVFQDLTPLGPPSPEALRRALVEPGARLGFRFEDEHLVRQMVAAVGTERGALPLLAFAVSRLWEERDREGRILTRAAYERLGGVAGALARHAEATLQSIGPAQEPLVHEVFRNLVTAQGTRGARDRTELLSVFGQRGADAAGVLDALIGARLLTEYEAQDVVGVGAAGAARVEIVHESLLSHWPRLERWLAQDAEGALLRDQLRQAAAIWHERGRPEELLWTGRAFREFALWRERYAGGLSATETAFAEAMEAHAVRGRRRRRLAVATALTALAVGLGIVGALWLQARRAREEARSEARHREAAQLLSLGRAQLAEEPAEALAYAIASLGRADNLPARRFAVEALWHGAAQLRFAQGQAPRDIVFSPDGAWATVAGPAGVFLWPRDGGPSRRIAAPEGPRMAAAFGADGRTLATWAWGRTEIRVWSLPAGTLLRTIRIPPGTGDGEGSEVGMGGWGDAILAATPEAKPSASGSRWVTLSRIPLDGSPPHVLGRVEAGKNRQWGVDLPRGRVLELRAGVLTMRPLAALETPPRLLGRLSGTDELLLQSPYASSWDSWLCATIRSGQRRLWLVDEPGISGGRVLHGAQSSGVTGHGPASRLSVDPAGRFVSGPGDNGRLLWDLAAPPDAQPTLLRSMTRDPDFGLASPFTPDRDWLPVARPVGIDLWPVRQKRPHVLVPVFGLYAAAAFSPDGQSLATVSTDLDNEGEVRLWPLSRAAGETSRLLHRDHDLRGGNIVFDPHGRFVATPRKFKGEVVVLPLDGAPQRVLRGYGMANDIAIDRGGRRLAGVLNDPAKEAVSIRVWDLEKGDFKDLDPRVKADDCGAPFDWTYAWVVGFRPDGGLVTDAPTGLRLWDVERGTSRQLRAYGKDDCTLHGNALTADGRRVFTAAANGGFSHDLEEGARREITSHEFAVMGAPVFTLDPSGQTLVTGGYDGVVRVGPATGEEPHLLYGHSKGVDQVVVSPDGRSILSTSRDGTIRLWPVPEGPPLHTLPYEALLTRLRSLTNLRAVPDAKSPTGYKVEVGPFPGWAKVPVW